MSTGYGTLVVKPKFFFGDNLVSEGRRDGTQLKHIDITYLLESDT